MNKDQAIRIGDRVTICRRGKKGTYVANFWWAGQHRRRSLKTTNLKVARTRGVKLEYELLHGDFRPATELVEIGVAVARFVGNCGTEGLRPKTVKKYATLLQAFSAFAGAHGAKFLSHVTPELVDQFRAERKTTLSPKSMRNDAVTLKGFFRWCQQRKLVSINPMAEMTFRRVVLPPRGGPSLEQLTLLLTLAQGIRRAQIAVLAFTGCRSGELQRLRIEDVDLPGGWIQIVSREGGETKTGHSRKVPIHVALRAILEQLPQSQGPWFFVAPSSKKYPNGGHEINVKHLNEDFLALLAKARLPVGRKAGFTLHSLRHTFETVCVNANIPQRVVDNWLGHQSDRSMASIYYRLSDQESMRFMSKVPFGNGEPAASAGQCDRET